MYVKDPLYSFSTLQEIQLAMRITAGALDTIEVQKLLHQDFLNLYRYLQVHVHSTGML